MLDAYHESRLIEQTAIRLFEELGYETANCYDEWSSGTSTLGRETMSDVVLTARLRRALQRLNPNVPNEALDLAIEELARDRSTLNPANANHEVYKLIRQGISVRVRRPDGGEDDERLRIIDFDTPENNDFFLASQFWVTGELYKRRADLVGFVNGLPFIFIELKAAHKRLEDAYHKNLRDYKDTIPQLFWCNAFIILSNGSASRIGTVTADWEHFNEWKKISGEGDQGIVSLDTIIKGVCDKHRFLDILENFILFQNADQTPIKILAKNHQYLGTNNVIEAFKDIEERQGKLGVFWHTQGSGKSFSMIFFSQKILRKFEGNYTFLVVTDRKELDEQIYANFSSVGAVTEKEVHAVSGEHLKRLLRENHRNIFTLIQKFGTKNGLTFPVLSERSDIIVIADEAHRSQYDEFARNMRAALPNAAFIAFTGTPLMTGEELTRRTFGDYVSIYNFKQSVDDGATVPLFYENRIPELQLTNENLNEDLERVIEEAVLDEEQERKLEREFAREYHLITCEDRLEEIAKDIVAHFLNRGYQGKAMVVSVDKPTAVKMYDKVQKYWRKAIEELQGELSAAQAKDAQVEISARLRYMRDTDMAVVVSPEQNEISKFQGLGLDILPHRRRMVQEELADKFKDAKDPFRIVFVCAMWITGFDVQPLSTIYLDKPMRNHTLMQTIARANRVFEGKTNGLIVDYIGVFRDLQKALAIYGSGAGGGIGEGDTPVKPKSALVKELRAAIEETIEFGKEKGFDPDLIISTGALDKIRLLDLAVDAILVNDESKLQYLALANRTAKLYKAILPDPEAGKFTQYVALFKVIAAKIGSLSPEVDISQVMQDVEDLLDRSIAPKGYVISGPLGDYDAHRIDLSKIDFEALRREFVDGKKRIQTERVKNAIAEKLDKMLKRNRLRINFHDKFQELIDEYNAGALNIELFFDKLLAFAKELNQEEKRGIAENLTEEELALFDLLFRSGLTKKEEKQVKKAASDLLDVLKREKLVLDWRKRQQTRADVLLTIQTVLDEELPRSYTPDLYQQKCDAVYQHVYESYFGAGKSIYDEAA